MGVGGEWRGPVQPADGLRPGDETGATGTDISSVFVRSAPTIAMAAACADTYSKGRFVLGLGSSHKVQVEGKHGLPYSKPLTRIKETMEIARAL